MTQPVQPQRPTASLLQPTAQTNAAWGAMGLAGLGGLKHGLAGFPTAAFDSRLGSSLMIANPKQRMQQMKMDSQWLRNARQADQEAGYVSFAKRSASNRREEETMIERLRREAKARGWDPRSLQEQPPVAAEMDDRLAGMDEAGRFPVPDVPPPVEERAARAFAQEGTFADAVGGTRPPGPAPVPPSLGHLPGMGAPRSRLSDVMAAVNRRLVTPNGKLTVLGRAALLPLGVGGVFGLAHGYKTGVNAFDALREGQRYDAAMTNLDPAEFGDPTFQGHWEADPEGMRRAMRDSFSVLNKYAPRVAKDPVLAREYMKRLTMDPSARMAPEAYLNQIRGAIDLERAIQGSEPSLFTGLGNVTSLIQ